MYATAGLGLSRLVSELVALRSFVGAGPWPGPSGLDLGGRAGLDHGRCQGYKKRARVESNHRHFDTVPIAAVEHSTTELHAHLPVSAA